MASVIAQIFYLTVDSEQVNEYGWECDVGRNYLAARNGDVSRGVYEKAARIVFPRFLDTFNYIQAAERIWTELQNVWDKWSTREVDNVECFTDFPRSMDVGDYIVFTNMPDKKFVVASKGFQVIDNT